MRKLLVLWWKSSPVKGSLVWTLMSSFVCLSSLRGAMWPNGSMMEVFLIRTWKEISPQSTQRCRKHEQGLSHCPAVADPNSTAAHPAVQPATILFKCFMDHVTYSQTHNIQKHAKHVLSCSWTHTDAHQPTPIQVHSLVHWHAGWH